SRPRGPPRRAARRGFPPCPHQFPGVSSPWGRNYLTEAKQSTGFLARRRMSSRCRQSSGEKAFDLGVDFRFAGRASLPLRAQFARLLDASTCGEVSERFKEHAWKACVGETQPWVRIPPSPPYPKCPVQKCSSSAECCRHPRYTRSVR